jgi:peroxiredoxin
VADSDSSATSRLGDAVPDFELPDHEGKSWNLSDHLARGPVVLVFYRGDW